MESDLDWGIVLYFLKVAFGHLFLISLWMGPCVLVGAHGLNFGSRVYESVQSAVIGHLICIGSVYCNICITYVDIALLVFLFHLQQCP